MTMRHRHWFHSQRVPENLRRGISGPFLSSSLHQVQAAINPWKSCYNATLPILLACLQSFSGQEYRSATTSTSLICVVPSKLNFSFLLSRRSILLICHIPPRDLITRTYIYPVDHGDRTTCLALRTLAISSPTTSYKTRHSTQPHNGEAARHDQWLLLESTPTLPSSATSRTSGHDLNPTR